MKNTGRFLSIVAAVVQLLSLLSYFVVVLLQRFFKELMTSNPEVTEVFSFPIVQTLQILLLTGAVLLVAVGAFTAGRSIWAELLSLLLIVLVVPLLARFGGIAESMLMSSKGAMTVVSLSTLQGITAFPLMFSGMASSLALAAAGMSMTFKKLTASK